MSRVRTFLTLPWGTKLGYLQTGAMFAGAEVALRVLPLASAARIFRVTLVVGAPTAGCQPVASPPVFNDRERRAARLIFVVSPRLYGSRRGCLRRSLVLGCVLRRHAPQLQIGVRRENDRTLAHAWIEIAGRPIEARSDHLAFSPAS